MEIEISRREIGNSTAKRSGEIPMREVVDIHFVGKCSVYEQLIFTENVGFSRRNCFNKTPNFASKSCKDSSLSFDKVRFFYGSNQ